MKKALTLTLLIASHSALADDSALAQCDRLRSPFDGNTTPIHYHPDAILPALRDACLAALANDPDNPRLLYQTGAAHALLLMNEELSRHPKTQERRFLREYGLMQSSRHYLQRAADAGYFPARLTLTNISYSGDHGKSKAALDALLAEAKNNDESRAIHLFLGHWHALHIHHDRDNAEAHRNAMRLHYQKAADLGAREALLILAKHSNDPATGEKTVRDLAAQGHLPALQTLGAMQMARNDPEGLAQTVAELKRLGASNPDYHISARYLEGMALANGKTDAEKKQGLQYLQEAAAGGHSEAKAQLRWQAQP